MGSRLCILALTALVAALLSACTRELVNELPALAPAPAIQAMAPVKPVAASGTGRVDCRRS